MLEKSVEITVEVQTLKMDNMMSVSGREAYIKYYTTTRTLKRHRTWTIAEYICEENNRNFVDPNGKAGVNLNQAGPAKKEE